MFNVFSYEPNGQTENQKKMAIVRKVIENSHIAYEDNNPLIDDKHLSLNLFLAKEFKDRFDKMASILQQVLETPNILEEYLEDSEKKRLLSDSTIKNLEYLIKWCKTEFKKESDFKVYQALVKETIDELYSHESYFMNFSARSTYCCEIRSKLEALSKKLTDSRYVCMVYSSSQDFFLKRREGSLTLTEIDHKQAIAQFMDIGVDVTASLSTMAKPAEICISAPVPPPPPPLQINLQADTQVKIISDYKPVEKSASAAFINEKSINAQLNILNEKRQKRAEQQNMSELELLTYEPQKKSEPEYLKAIRNEAKRKEMLRFFRHHVLRSLIEETASNRVDVDAQATSRAKQFRQKCSGAKNKKRDESTSSDTIYAKFFEMQRRQAMGKEEEYSSSNEEWSENSEASEKPLRTILLCDELSPPFMSDETTSQDECDIETNLKKLSLGKNI